MSRHMERHVATVDPRWGIVRSVIPTADNLFCGFWTANDIEGDRVFFLDKECGRFHPTSSSMLWALSYDGSKMATAIQRFENGTSVYEIRINGVLVYPTAVPCHHITELVWLSDHELAWSGYQGDDACDHVFVNGVERPTLQIEEIAITDQRFMTRVKEGDRCFILFDDGTRTAEQPYPGEWTFAFDWYEQRMYQGPHADQQRDEMLGERVRFQGVDGRWFDSIEQQQGRPEFVYTEDRKRVAYVGVRYPTAVRICSRVGGRLFDACEDSPMPWWGYALLPFAVLVSPYGPAHALIQSSRRFFVVDHDRVWNRSYASVDELFYTANQQLVAHVWEGRKQAIVIDEELGPLFDGIYNARYLKDENVVCYIGQRGFDYYRVIVRL